MNNFIRSFFVLTFFGYFCVQTGFAGENVFKINPCKLDDETFKKEIMSVIENDAQMRETKERAPEQSNVIMSHEDYNIKETFDYYVKTKNIVYYGYSLGTGGRTVRISFDAKNGHTINDVTACIIHFKDGKWTANIASVISDSMPSNDETDLFTSDKQVGILFPNDEPPSYAVLIYTKKIPYLWADGLFKGFSAYVSTPYSTTYPFYNVQQTFTIPLKVRHYAELKGNEDFIKTFTFNKKVDEKKIIYSLFLGEVPVLRDSNVSQEGSLLPYFVFTTFDSWESLLKPLADIYEKKISDGKETIKSELKNIGEYYKKKVEELTALDIYFYLSSNYTWENYHSEVGGGRIPHDVSFIVNYRSGDCKDIATVFTGLLRAAGYKAYPIRIRTNNMRNYDLEDPVNDFDHVITGYYEKDGTFKILDASVHFNSYYTGLTDMSSDRNYVTWMYDDNGFFSVITGRTPTVDQSANEYRNINFDVKDDGALSCNIKYQSDNCGAWAGDLNRSMNGQATESRKKAAVMGSIFESDDVDSFEYEILERSNDYISFSGTAELNKLDNVTYTGNKGSEQISVELYFPKAISDIISVYEGTRSTDYILSGRTDHTYMRRIYNVPDGYTIKSIPDPSTFYYDNDYFTFQIETEIVGNTVECRSMQYYKKTVVPVAKVKDGYKKEAEKIKAFKNYAKTQRIIFEKANDK